MGEDDGPGRGSQQPIVPDRWGCRSRDLEAFLTLPMPIRACTSHVGVLVHGNRLPVCTPPVPHVSSELAVAPRPPERRCRSGHRGRGWERPCTLRTDFSLDRKILTAATGDRAGSNLSDPVPQSTPGGLVPRPGAAMDAQWGVRAIERQYRDRRASRRPRTCACPTTFTREGAW